jgi:hypothetical protein
MLAFLSSLKPSRSQLEAFAKTMVTLNGVVVDLERLGLGVVGGRIGRSGTRFSNQGDVLCFAYGMHK